MTKNIVAFLASLMAGVLTFDASSPAHAQADQQPPADETASSPPDEQKDSAEQEATNESILVQEVNPDEMADDLNARQQLQQTFTLKRIIDGEETSSEKRTVIYSRDAPVRETEAAPSAREILEQKFDSEVLTRKEAFEEARLDFTLADKNRDGKMTGEEFSDLVATWRSNATRTAEAPTEEIRLQRQYDSFLEEISEGAADLKSNAYAQKKFQFLAGEKATITREEFIREYLLDFDSMDADSNTILEAEELSRFRSIIRGEDL